MFVTEIMSTCVAECTEDMKLEEVFDLIQKCDHGLVVVIDSHAHRVPIGIVNARSICEQIITRGRNPRNLLAGSVMDSRIKKVLETDVVECITDTAEYAAIVVVDNKRRISGLVAKEKVNEIASVAVRRHEEAPAAATVPEGPSHAISEIPAFGGI
jgi:predicted transcriptional regulator